MGSLHGIDRRREPRSQANFVVTIWEVDTRGERFLQEARVRDISLSGGLLTGIEADLRSGDLIGVLYRARKARYGLFGSATTTVAKRFRRRFTGSGPMSARGARCN